MVRPFRIFKKPSIKSAGHVHTTQVTNLITNFISLVLSAHLRTTQLQRKTKLVLSMHINLEFKMYIVNVIKEKTKLFTESFPKISYIAKP